MRRITTADIELLLEISPCTDEEIDLFTAGDCWKLAHELYSHGVGKLVGIAESNNHSFWSHMLIELPDGTYLDAYGIQTEEQLLARWGGFFSEAVVVSYDLSDPKCWDELTCEQDLDLSTAEDLFEVTAKLMDWVDSI